MSITDKLREWASVEVPYKYGHQLTAIANRIDAELAERYVKLPVDADDVPIHIGDEMVFLDLCGNKSEPFVVEGFESPDMWLVHCDEGRVRYTANPMHTRHYYESTVEDVLAEFANKVCNSGHQWGLDAADTIAEYAAKLRLKEGE